MSRGVESRVLFLDQRLYDTNITNSKYTISRRDRRFEHELLEKITNSKINFNYKKQGFRLPLNKIFSRYLIKNYGFNKIFCNENHPYFKTKITTKNLLMDIWIKRSATVSWRKYNLLKWELNNF